MENIRIIDAKDAGEAVITLWEEAFGDTREEIKRFFAAAGNSRIVCLEDGGKLQGMAVLIPVTVRGLASYYGYAVCTGKDYRKKGICRKLHSEIFRLCKEEGRGYILHPAEPELFDMYEKFGMTVCGYCGEKYIAAAEGKYAFRRANTADVLRLGCDTKWESAMAQYALGAEGAVCAVSESGAFIYGEKDGDIFCVSYCSGASDEEIAALCTLCSCRGAKVLTREGNIPYLCGFNIPFCDIYIDFTFE